MNTQVKKIKGLAEQGKIDEIKLLINHKNKPAAMLDFYDAIRYLARDKNELALNLLSQLTEDANEFNKATLSGYIWSGDEDLIKQFYNNLGSPSFNYDEACIDAYKSAARNNETVKLNNGIMNTEILLRIVMATNDIINVCGNQRKQVIERYAESYPNIADIDADTILRMVKQIYQLMDRYNVDYDKARELYKQVESPVDNPHAFFPSAEISKLSYFQKESIKQLGSHGLTPNMMICWLPKHEDTLFSELHHIALTRLIIEHEVRPNEAINLLFKSNPMEACAIGLLYKQGLRMNMLEHWGKKRPNEGFDEKELEQLLVAVLENKCSVGDGLASIKTSLDELLEGINRRKGK